MTKADIYLNEDIVDILENGYLDEDPRPHYSDGTPAHTLSVNHKLRKYDLSKGEFPICTKRKQAWKTSIREALEIYKYATNVISEMASRGVDWWDQWDIGDGTIGHRYGFTVARYDLVRKLIAGIKKQPYGRRHIMDIWQYQDLEETEGLAPCAFCTIWNVRKGKDGKEYLDMVLIQRSGDMLVASGAGHSNEIQYAALLIMIARVLGYEPGVFSHFVANEQIYDRHMDNAKIVLEREATDCKPYLVLHKEKGCDFFDINIEDFELVDYKPFEGEKLTFDLGI